MKFNTEVHHEDAPKLYAGNGRTFGPVQCSKGWSRHHTNYRGTSSYNNNCTSNNDACSHYNYYNYNRASTHNYFNGGTNDYCSTYNN